MTFEVAVIGGGVSGLAAAWRLQREGRRVVVLERQVRPGGNAQSTRFGGFLMEHGPSSITGASPIAAEVSASLGIDHLISRLGPGVRYRYLHRGRALHRIATHPFGFLFSNYLTPCGRLRLLGEPLVPVKVDDGEETITEFVSRRFGTEFAHRVMDPLAGGLFAGTADSLSMKAVFPSLPAMEQRYGSIIRGVVARHRAGGRMPARQLSSWTNGMATLPHALARDLGSAVRTGVTVRRIHPFAAGYRIDAGAAGTLQVPAVVVATQPHVTAMLLDDVDEDAAGAAAEIAAPPLSVVFLGYHRKQVDHPLDGLGYLTPSGENACLTGALFCSTMFPGRAPEGHVALAGYIGGTRAPDLAMRPTLDLIAAAQEEFGDLLGARGDPVVARTQYWPRGLPQYRPGHGDRVSRLIGLGNRRPGLYLTGNYFQGPGVAACLAQASQTATRITGYLSGYVRRHGAELSWVSDRP